jgi:hypothetical protein
MASVVATANRQANSEDDFALRARRDFRRQRSAGSRQTMPPARLDVGVAWLLSAPRI